MVRLAQNVVLALCVVVIQMNWVIGALPRDVMSPPSKNALKEQHWNKTLVPSPNQHFLVARYLSGEIDRKQFETRWYMWEYHHVGRATKYGVMKAHKGLEKRAGLDEASAVVTIAAGIGITPTNVNRFARYLADRWNRRYADRQGGPGDIESVGQVTPAITSRMALPTNPTGMLDAQAALEPLGDAMNCLIAGGARRACLTADYDGNVRMTASFSIGNPGDIDTNPPSDADCENGSYTTCSEGEDPPTHDELKRTPPTLVEKRDTGILSCPSIDGGSCAPACSAVYTMHCDSLGLVADDGWQTALDCKACNCNGTPVLEKEQDGGRDCQT